MANQENILDHLSEVFKSFEAGLNGKTGGALHALQQSSFDLLKKYQFPDRKHEDWKYTFVQHLVQPSFQLAKENTAIQVAEIKDLDTYKIIISNGRVLWNQMDTSLTATGVKIMTFTEMLEDPTLSSAFSDMIKQESPSANKAFEFLNLAFQSDGFAIDLPKGFRLDKPIEIQILHDDREISFSHPLYFVHAREDSHVSVIERYETNQKHRDNDTAGLVNASAFIYVHRNAHINHYRWQNLPAAQNLVYKLSATQHRDSRFETYAFDFGGATIRNNIDVELEDQNTYSSLQAAYIARGKQSMDHQTKINHKMPHCESHELYKGIIDDQASGGFNGKVYVHQDAQKTNAFQQNDSLVLSDHARMNSKPQLEIFADDVKCSHGATIGQMDQKSLFYLMSRGIGKEEAKHMLKSAFLAEVLDTVPIAPLSDYIRQKMSLDK